MSLLIKHLYRFRGYTLDTDQRVLIRDSKPVALTPKVFDTLLILVENNGRIVEKEELMNRLWPDTFVEEANLTFNIKQLRKSLGDDARSPVYIETISRRGYRFIAIVEEVLSERDAVNDRIVTRFETSDVQSLPDAIPVSRAASTSVSKSSIALRATLVMVLVGIGLVSWKFSRDSNKNAGEKSRVDSNSGLAPLKLEKLTGTGQSRQVAISPDGKYIAYTRYFDQKSSIWLRQLTTNTNVEIVQPGGIIYGLAFTNSGESLFFVRRDLATALYRVSVLGGVVTKIVDSLEGNFSISSDDSQIAFIRKLIKPDGQREYSLMIANSNGTGERKLSARNSPDRLDVPVWSPDDQSIICSFGNSEGGGQEVSIVEVSVADGIKKELSSERFFHITKMAWLPHKSGLLLSGRKNLGDNNQLWRVSYPAMQISRLNEALPSYLDLSVASGADKAVASQTTRISDLWVGPGREPRNLKKVTQATDFCWTRSGRVVYLSTASGKGDLWIMQADGTEQRQLTNDPSANGAPAVTSDSRFIVFVSNRTGGFQVWRMNVDGGNQIQLTEGAGKNYPAISPDGKWVLYNTTGDWNLWKVSIDGGEPTRLTGYVASHPSVSPDGKMIACLGGDESKRELLIVPVEGGPPLKRLDLAGANSRLQWTEDGQSLIYAAERNGVSAILKQSMDGSLPKQIVNFGEDELFDFGYSCDGQNFAVTRGGWQHDVVLLTDLNRY